jgi:hypothetical protein
MGLGVMADRIGIMWLYKLCTLVLAVMAGYGGAQSA